MKLSKNSNLLMSFFVNHGFINHTPLNKNGYNIIIQLYNDILNSHKYLKELKKTIYYTTNISKINYVYQIPKPRTFNLKSFPTEVIKRIDDLSSYYVEYNFSLFNRDITIFFISEKNNINLQLVAFNKYIDAIIMWLYILNIYSTSKCSKKFTTYFYFTSLEKRIPSSNIYTLNEYHVNTAFTRTCQSDSEIVVFRKEEWFKVFIHETFHNFALDFSGIDSNYCDNFILNLFPVNSEVNLYEAYSESWAEILNAMFCSFIILKNKTNFNDFLSNFDKFINFERTYSFFQLVKTLNFMGLTYKDLYSKNSKSKLLRDTFYKEETNVLSYYIIKTILMNDYQMFMSWCNSHNISLLHFNNIPKNKTNFCKLIERNYKTSSMLNGVNVAKQFISYLKTNNVENTYIMNNLRMTICELN
jgi:hypothetical protein